jgi:hypothetical protein
MPKRTAEEFYKAEKAWETGFVISAILLWIATVVVRLSEHSYAALWTAIAAIVFTIPAIMLGYILYSEKPAGNDDSPGNEA